MTDSVKVAVRVRPFNQRELAAKSECVLTVTGRTTTITRPGERTDRKSFSFDHSYWSHDSFTIDENGVYKPNTPASKYADQEKVFRDLGQGVLDNAWKGYNAALFAYGQTGSGKSYSMVGYGKNRGIVPITCSHLFQAIDANTDSKKQFQVTFSMLEIYNEQVRDLLVSARHTNKPSSLKVRMKPGSGFYCEGLKQVPVEQYADIERLMDEGVLNRTTASTNMNATSSRSHMVITIGFKQVFPNEQGLSTTKTSEISLVDLAGSERAKSTGATGDRLKEGSNINLSLLTLGQVIHSLAEASGKKKKMAINYRGSILTKLLMSALGGNSKTVMIAALSPAAMNYEETLSTLRYADRAKQIQTKAVINESLTDKIIRELKEENQRLLEQLGTLQLGGMTGDKALNVQKLLEENQRQMQQAGVSWEERLEQAKREWHKSQQEAAAADGGKQMSSAHMSQPYLTNVNEDPQLSGVIKVLLNTGDNTLGKPGHSAVNIELRGLGIQHTHAVISNTGNEVSICRASTQAAITINGRPLTQAKAVLKHHDRVKLGSNNLYLYIGFPVERDKQAHSSDHYTYDLFHTELAAESGFNERDLVEAGAGEQVVDPELLLVYRQYVELLPKVLEANAISDDLNKGVRFEVEVKNLATHDTRGRAKQKEITVRLENSTKKVWLWSQDKFMNRKYMMEALYHQWVETGRCDVKQEEDPFWDPVEDIFLGSCHVWLTGLAYCMESDEQLEVRDYRSSTVARLHVKLSPCDTLGKPLQEEMLVLDPLELHGRRLDFLVCLLEGSSVKWVLADPSRGSYCRFSFHDEPGVLQTKVTWGQVGPRYNFRRQLTVKHIDDRFLSYLQHSALVVELWGTQTDSSQANGPSIGVKEQADDSEEQQLKTLQQEHTLLQHENTRLQRQVTSLPLNSLSSSQATRKKSIADIGMHMGEIQMTRRPSLQMKINSPRRKTSVCYSPSPTQQLMDSPRSPARPSVYSNGDVFTEGAGVGGEGVLVSVKPLTPVARLQRRLSTTTTLHPSLQGEPASILPSLPSVPPIVPQHPATGRRTSQQFGATAVHHTASGGATGAEVLPSVGGVEVEIIKALKNFFKDMKGVQRMVKKVKKGSTDERREVSDTGAAQQEPSIEDIDSELQSNLQTLKDVVLSMVRKARHTDTTDAG